MIARCCGRNETCCRPAHKCCESFDTRLHLLPPLSSGGWLVSELQAGEGLANGAALIQEDDEVSVNWKELRLRESRMRGASVWFNSELEAAGESSPTLECVCVCVRVRFSVTQ